MAIISQTMIDRVKITITVKLQVTYGLSIGISTFDDLTHSNGQGQSRSHLDSEYCGNGERYGTNYNCRKMESLVWAFVWHIYV